MGVRYSLDRSVPLLARQYVALCDFQATVVILEKLHCIVDKLSPEEVKSEILPIVFATLEVNSTIGQVKCHYTLACSQNRVSR